MESYDTKSEEFLQLRRDLGLRLTMVVVSTMLMIVSKVPSITGVPRLTAESSCKHPFHNQCAQIDHEVLFQRFLP